MECSNFMWRILTFCFLFGMAMGGKAGRNKITSSTSERVKCFCKVPSNVVLHCPGDTVECDKASGCLKTQTDDYKMQVCAPKGSTEEGCRIEKKDGKEASVCTCRTDLCNGQNQLTSSNQVVTLLSTWVVMWLSTRFIV